MKRTDPFAVAQQAFYNPETASLNMEHRLRSAVNAALIADRRATLAYWLCRWRQKLIWFGGWERPNCGGFDLWRYGKLADVTPITIASCYTHFGWGWQLKLPGTFLVWCGRTRGLYLSADATPNAATRWLIGKRWGA